MTATALSILDNDPDGFFLMVEGGRIDHAGHGNDIQRNVLETVEFANTVQVAMDWAAGRTDTLILVSADHETGGLTVLENNGFGALPTVEWSSGSHTGVNVPVYGWGVNAKMISGVMDNTEMFAVVIAGPEASNPDPQDGDTGPPVLSWKPGIYAASHQVYFGSVFDDVNNATGASPQADATYVPAGPLEVSTTYYWRVDEVNDLHPDSPWVGSVWSFTTLPGNSTQPDPANGAVGVAIDATLGWLPGPTAATHDVYFGTSSPPPFIGNQAEPNFNPGPLEPGTTYYWQVDEVEADGTTMYTGDIWSFKTLRPGTGTILYEIWEDIGGEAVLYLTGSPDYPLNPSSSTELSSFDAPVDRGEYFGGRLHGYLHPETSGDYTFWIASDDSSELWLSTDDSPANAVLISMVSGWADHLEFDSFNVIPSGPISLVGGQKYYIMALYKEGWGGDNCAVAWQGPDSPEREVIAGYYLSPFMQLKAYSADPADGAINVQKTPTLSWLPGATAATHDVYFSADQQAVIDSNAFISNQAETSYSLSGLVKGTTYYWRVDEVEADGTTKHTGDVWSFMTAPGYATRPNPANNAVSVAIDAILSWSPGFTAATHDVYFGTSSPPAFIGNQTEPNFNPGPLEPGTTYYWQIDAIEADGTTIYTGDIWSFK
ncbi:MAG: alkaline phosphatase, partial [Gammaproteobacteria bacterium]